MTSPSRPSWLAEVQRAPAVIPARATRPAPMLLDAHHRPIATPEGWARRREELAAAWRAFLGVIPAPRAVAAPVVLEEDRPEGVVRQLIRYEAEPGLPVEGYLLRPEGPATGRPGVVVLHSTVDYTIRQPAGLEGPEDKWIGLHLARRGYVAFCPRCFLWQYGGPGRYDEAVAWLRRRHPGVTGMAKMLFDAVRAVDLLASQPDVDPPSDRRDRPFAGREGGPLPRRLRRAGPRHGLERGGDRPGRLELGRPLVSRRGDPPPRLRARSGPGPRTRRARAFLLIGGDSADGDASWPSIDAVRPVWSLLGAADAVGLFNHRQGHAFPEIAQARAYEWLDWFLRA